jgi:hypothetical protein
LLCAIVLDYKFQAQTSDLLRDLAVRPLQYGHII